MPKNSSKSNPKIAIIGGSGFYDQGIFKKERDYYPKTPYGYPSAPVEIGDFLGIKVAFLARHGKKHQLPPHMVPQRANIWALKKLGVEKVIGVCAVGSLKENLNPGEIVICDQFIDFTMKREYTFFDNSTTHISIADPFCPEMTKIFYQEGKKLKMPIHPIGTYFCIEGPRFSTRGESRFFRNFADVIGMTLVPEVILARESGMCYASLAMVTDHDVWDEHPVSAGEIKRVMAENIDRVKRLLKASIIKIKGDKCDCADALKSAKL